MSRFGAGALVLLLCSSFADARAADITIEIRGNGTTAQYIQTPEAPGNPPNKQLNVVVSVDDKVIWKNIGDTQHTAHSDLKLPNGTGGFKFLFEERIDPGASQDYTFTDADYTNARAALGIEDGRPVHLGYYCANHPATMGGKLVLVKTEAAKSQLLKESGHGAAEKEKK